MHSSVEPYACLSDSLLELFIITGPLLCERVSFWFISCLTH